MSHELMWYLTMLADNHATSVPIIDVVNLARDRLSESAVFSCIFMTVKFP